jgi:flagellar hook-associated protein 2
MSSLDVIGSQIDVSSLVSQLMLIERQPVVKLTNQVTSLQNKVTAYQNFNTRLSALSNTVNTLLYGSSSAPLTKPGSFEARLAQSVFGKGTATSSDEKVLTATAEGATAGGSYSITVNKLAKAQSTASAGFSDIDTKLGTGTVKVGGVDIELTDQNNTLKGLRDAINDEDTGVTASIVNDGSNYKLLLTSKETGIANKFDVEDFDKLDLTNGGTAIGFTQTQAAANAELEVNGIAITSGSNTVKDAIEGVTLNLKSVSSDPVTLDTAVNSDSIISALKSMVTAYNAANTYINSQFTYDSTKETSGVLAGDATLRSIQSKLQSQMTQGVSSPLSPYRTASQLGLSFNRDGSMELDETKLKAALSKDFKGTAAFFLGDESSGSMLTKLGETLSGLTDSLQNPIKGAMDGLNRNIKSIQSSIAMYELRLESKEDQLTAQFTAADMALRLMKVNQSSLSAALSGLSSSTK